MNWFPTLKHNYSAHLMQCTFSYASQTHRTNPVTRNSMDGEVVMDVGCMATKYQVCEMCLRMVTASDVPMVKTIAVHKFLEERTIATPFLHSYLLNLSKKKKVFNICCNCDSWMRRQCTPLKMRRCGGKKGYLLVDQLILSIMLPGQYQPPEMRITQRLINIIRQNKGHNWLASICPPLVVRALCDNDIVMASRQVLKSISVAAWQSGRRQIVFGNATYAKFIRCAGPDH
jgi:hypothetical protein